MPPKNPPPRERPRVRVPTPDIRSKSPISGSNSMKRSYKLQTSVSTPSLKVQEDKAARSLSSPSKSHKRTNSRQDSRAKGPIIYRPPSSLAGSRSRSQSPAASRVRTPNIHQQRSAATSDRRARQTTLYLNITTAPPQTRSPLGTINANNLPQMKNAHREADRDQQEPIQPRQMEHMDLPSNSFRKLDFERVDENQRSSLSPQLFDPPDLSSSPPPMLDLEDEDLEDDDLEDDDSWDESSFLQQAKNILIGRKDDGDDAPVFWTPEDADIPLAASNSLDANTSLRANPIEAELANLERLSYEKEGPKTRPGTPPKVKTPDHLYNEPAPKTIPFLTDNDALKHYETINFNSDPQWHHVVQLHEVYKTRCVKFESVKQEDWDLWFAPSTSDQPIMLKQQWKNCSPTDIRILRDIHCAFYLALRNVLSVVSDIVSEGHISTASGWLEVCVSPVTFLSEMRAALQWDEEIINRFRVEYGLDLLHFVDTQYELKSRTNLGRPDVDLTNDQNGHGYFLTCKRTRAGQYKLQLSPPQIWTQWSIKQGDNGVECIVKPTAWHPHFLFSITAVTPRFSVGQGFEWLEWDNKQFCFSGIVPDDYQPHMDPSGNLCVRLDITMNFTQYFIGKMPEGPHLLYLNEGVTARSYGILPVKPAAPPAATPTIYSPNPLQLVWGSHKLGFDKRHSEFILGKAREYESEIYQGRAGEDAKYFATHGLFPWDPKEPQIQSWGRVSWCDFLEQRKARAEYLKKDPRGRMEVIEDIRRGPRLGPLDPGYKTYSEEVDEDLEEMRRVFENLNHEAHAIIWLHTLYRETVQDRLEDESWDMEKAGLRNRQTLGLHLRS
ncbi:hypothetical protein TWF506_008503 [Arthrobotrys conoides]|uniref:Uncharacterized protein n=1 Tax=Arthrobotrys conoides TaxID=74498 RepID=A0AAN8N618_9PEZI